MMKKGEEMRVGRLVLDVDGIGWIWKYLHK